MNENEVEKSGIYIFSEIKSIEDRDRIKSLRTILIENSISGIIFFDLKIFSKKLEESFKRENLFKKEILIEELIVLEANLYILPIIFYGLNENQFVLLANNLGLECSENIGWIDDPLQIAKLKKLINQMSGE